MKIHCLIDCGNHHWESLFDVDIEKVKERKKHVGVHNRFINPFLFWINRNMKLIDLKANEFMIWTPSFVYECSTQDKKKSEMKTNKSSSTSNRNDVAENKSSLINWTNNTSTGLQIVIELVNGAYTIYTEIHRQRKTHSQH